MAAALCTRSRPGSSISTADGSAPLRRMLSCIAAFIARLRARLGTQTTRRRSAATPTRPTPTGTSAPTPEGT